MPRRARRAKRLPVMEAAVYDSEIDDYVPNHTHSDSESEDSGEDRDERKPIFSQGMKGETKSLYEGPGKCPSCPAWVDTMTKDTKNAIRASKDIQQYAVIARYKRSSTNNEGDLKIHSIIIQSPLLRPLLEEVFKGLSGIVALDRLRFTAPFVPFFHRWQKFQLARWEAKGETRVHADLLYEALHAHIEEDLKISSDLIARGVITYEHLWALFVPGELISCRFGKHDVMCTVSRAEVHKEPERGKRSAFLITARYIDIGRDGLGLAVVVLTLPQFTGTVPISELAFEDLRNGARDEHTVFAMPAQLRPDITALKSRLIERGKKFESLQGIHYKEYEGDVIETYEGRRRTDAIRRKVKGRIMVDVEAFESSAFTFKTNLLPLDADFEPQGDELLDNYPDRLDHDPNYDNRTMQQRIDDLLISGLGKRGAAKLTEDQLILCGPKVRGYSLKSKCWAEFYVDNIKDVIFHNDAFSRVMLQDNYKSLITTFVTRHRSQNDKFDDIIPGKGKGLIILLTGEPGVGKTLTAETVAEELRAPLYSFGASELGSFADEVDRKLNEVFELCSRWKAVLLMDEADVFLQERSPHDMERNKIASVFLRILEYYQGMMFMTTNRVQYFDSAFRSRIHLNMEYPALNKETRTAIWNGFLKNSQLEIAITKEEIEALAEKAMNGREIKNTIKVASLLAGQRGQELDIGHINSVLEVNGYDQDGGYVLED